VSGRGTYPPLALICVDAAMAVWAQPAAFPEAEGRMVGYVQTVKRRSIASYGYEVSEAAGIAPDLHPTATTAALALLTALGGKPAVVAQPERAR
jgi:hypothetical protein